MRIKGLQFKNRDGAVLAARLDLPNRREPAAYAILAHCFTCTKNLKAIAYISRTLAELGIAVLRFDFTGLGESEGDFADTNLSSNANDLIDAAHFLETHYQAPEILIGHSFGGVAALQAGLELPSLKALVVIGTPSQSGYIKKLIGEAMPAISQNGQADVPLEGRTFRIKKQFVDDLMKKDLLETLKPLKCAFLILHSPFDNTVGIDHATALFKAAKHPKSFISLDQADHLLTRKADAVYAGRMIAAWAGKYISSQTEEGVDAESLSHAVMVSTAGQKYRTEINVRGHHLLSDEPIALGGKDLGPTPVEFLESALGACTSMTLRMYADRKQWPLDSISVKVDHQQPERPKGNDPAVEKRAKANFQRIIAVDGPLDDAQRRRLLEIADRCPVHRLLESGIDISTQLNDG